MTNYGVNAKMENINEMGKNFLKAKALSRYGKFLTSNRGKEINRLHQEVGYSEDFIVNAVSSKDSGEVEALTLGLATITEDSKNKIFNMLEKATEQIKEEEQEE